MKKNILWSTQIHQSHVSDLGLESLDLDLDLDLESTSDSSELLDSLGKSLWGRSKLSPDSPDSRSSNVWKIFQALFLDPLDDGPGAGSVI